MNKIDYFSDGSELACNCCGMMSISQKFYEMLNVARIIAGIPFGISSGCRCESHNKNEGGVDDSSHVIKPGKQATAVDIRCSDDAKRWIIIDALKRAGFNRIGISKNFIHVDCDPTKNEERLWTY